MACKIFDTGDFMTNPISSNTTTQTNPTVVDVDFDDILTQALEELAQSQPPPQASNTLSTQVFTPPQEQVARVDAQSLAMSKVMIRVMLDMLQLHVQAYTKGPENMIALVKKFSASFAPQISSSERDIRTRAGVQLLTFLKMESPQALAQHPDFNALCQLGIIHVFSQNQGLISQFVNGMEERLDDILENSSVEHMMRVFQDILGESQATRLQEEFRVFLLKELKSPPTTIANFDDLLEQILREEKNEKPHDPKEQEDFTKPSNFLLSFLNEVNISEQTNSVESNKIGNLMSFLAENLQLNSSNAPTKSVAPQNSFDWLCIETNSEITRFVDMYKESPTECRKMLQERIEIDRQVKQFFVQNASPKVKEEISKNQEPADDNITFLELLGGGDYSELKNLADRSDFVISVLMTCCRLFSEEPSYISVFAKAYVEEFIPNINISMTGIAKKIESAVGQAAPSLKSKFLKALLEQLEESKNNLKSEQE